MSMRTVLSWWIPNGPSPVATGGRTKLPAGGAKPSRAAGSAARGGLALLALGGLLGIAVPAMGQTVVEVRHDIAADTTWPRVDGIYLVYVPIEVAEGARLTLAPGVVVKFRPGAGLTVRGTLLAVGAPGDSIFFTSERDDNLAGDLPEDGPTHPAAGDWNGIAFADSGSDASVMQYCEVWFGGGGEAGALIACDGASPSIGASSLNAGTYGVVCGRGAAPRLSGVRINGCLSVPLALSPDSDPVFDAVVFGSEQDNGYDGIGLLESTLLENVRLTRRDTRIGTTLVENVTYVLLGPITVGRQATLRLQPGLVLKAIDAGAGITVHGRLEAEGSADSAIVFTSVRDDAAGGPWDTNRDASLTAPAPGDWGGLVFADSSSGALRSCRVRFGGDAALVEAGQRVDLVVSDCVLADGRRGLRAGDHTSLEFTGNEVRTCSGVPLEIAVGTSLAQVDNVFLGNGITAVGLLAGDVADGGLIRQLNIGGHTDISYYVDERLNVAGSLAIEPGVTIKFAPGSHGDRRDGERRGRRDRRPADRLHERAQRLRRQSGRYRGERLGAGPVPGRLGRHPVRPACDPAASLLDHCIFSFGGYGPDGVVRIGGMAPTITHCLFEWNLIGLHAEFFAGTGGEGGGHPAVGRAVAARGGRRRRDPRQHLWRQRHPGAVRLRRPVGAGYAAGAVRADRRGGGRGPAGRRPDRAVRHHPHSSRRPGVRSRPGRHPGAGGAGCRRPARQPDRHQWARWGRICRPGTPGEPYDWTDRCRFVPGCDLYASRSARPARQGGRRGLARHHLREYQRRCRIDPAQRDRARYRNGADGPQRLARLLLRDHHRRAGRWHPDRGALAAGDRGLPCRSLRPGRSGHVADGRSRPERQHVPAERLRGDRRARRDPRAGLRPARTRRRAAPEPAVPDPGGSGRGGRCEPDARAGAEAEVHAGACADRGPFAGGAGRRLARQPDRVHVGGRRLLRRRLQPGRRRLRGGRCAVGRRAAGAHDRGGRDRAAQLRLPLRRRGHRRGGARRHRHLQPDARGVHLRPQRAGHRLPRGGGRSAAGRARAVRFLRQPRSTRC